MPVALLLAAAVHSAVQGAAGAPPAPPARRPLPPTSAPLGLGSRLTEKAERLARRAARRLALLQDRRGAFRLRGARLPAPVAVTALGALAFLAVGETPGRTPHGPRIERAIRYLLDNQDRSGGPRDGYINDPADRYSKMHGHGFATLALVEVYGQLPAGGLVQAAELRTAIERAVALIERSQDQSGGWTYEPVPSGHEGSITICMVQALRAAKNSGFQVDDHVVHRAIRYVERSQKPDGSFRYQLGSDRSSTALTAAAVATLDMGGGYDSPAIPKGIAYLLHRGEVFGRPGLGFEVEGRFPFYERLYVGEALFFQHDLGPFERWYRSLVQRLEMSVDPKTDGWHSDRYGEAYATAMNILALSLPFQYLPIHQR